ncbi:hypothetical protein BXZ70DRAFT_952509 [Cristinia sonorae]|uniref:Uncharacterized protein n=1 Tax=Cristinia sonorae TaxID=1940300 RepID=A0A8K0UHE7_9AGAR|nr:hypothetical protein BXZ70DRAFT_952509 [Cristinia sonorae]
MPAQTTRGIRRSATTKTRTTVSFPRQKQFVHLRLDVEVLGPVPFPKVECIDALLPSGNITSHNQGHPAFTSSNTSPASPPGHSSALTDALKTIKEGSKIDSSLYDVIQLVERAGLVCVQELGDIHEAYSGLLWKHRQHAGFVRSVSDEFRSHVLRVVSMRNVGTPEKKAALCEWKKKVNNERTDEHVNAQRRELNMLAELARDYATRTEQDISSKARKLDSRICDLKMSREKVAAQLREVSDFQSTSVSKRMTADSVMNMGGFVTTYTASSASFYAAAFARFLHVSQQSDPPPCHKTKPPRSACPELRRRELETERRDINDVIRELEFKRVALSQAVRVPTLLRRLANDLDVFASGMTLVSDAHAHLILAHGEVQEMLKSGRVINHPLAEVVDRLGRELSDKSLALDVYARGTLST